MLDLAGRVAATEKAISRFKGKPFSWSDRRTCIHVARAQARALGHRPPAIPDFRSARGASTALKKAGYGSLEALLDSLFSRIPPASMWVGDLGMMLGEGPLDAIVVNAGSKVFGYAEGFTGLHVIEPVGFQPFKAAWRL